ncbi:hypothetical protein B0T18DRAFT_444118 [Schizothecium vesticola]|uniref:Uncharacterized protein n=1 Tax=Schizothecium vesticola TaxID=314040 RepID=A0AA40F5K6_9PEZI|nr:hypothetical protein B0T18DRAFT_444118 [Schizothecium vesticola]
MRECTRRETDKGDSLAGLIPFDEPHLINNQGTRGGCGDAVDPSPVSQHSRVVTWTGITWAGITWAGNVAAYALHPCEGRHELTSTNKRLSGRLMDMSCVESWAVLTQSCFTRQAVIATAASTSRASSPIKTGQDRHATNWSSRPEPSPTYPLPSP